MTPGSIEIPFGGKILYIETGRFARQANAALTITCGGTTVLVAACISKSAREGIDFFPLTVEYQEKTYAAGKIPGGFFKREGRPTQKEILSSRLIDRPIRPLFPEGLYNDVVVNATVLSSDGENDPDVLALIGASAVLHVSDIPFNGPFGAGRVAFVDGQYILNPTYAEREKSTLDFVLVGMENGIVMIEGEAKEISESEVVRALEFVFKEVQAVRQAQEKLRAMVGKPKLNVALAKPQPELKAKVEELSLKKLKEIYTTIKEKKAREDAQGELLKSITSDMSVYSSYKVGEREPKAGDIKMIFDSVEYDVVRRMIFDQNKRADGRGAKDIRELTSEINVLPRTHGSALFTRGQTQSLAVVTLGNRRDEQMVESLEGTSYSNFMLHYNFPAFSVGEARATRAPGRREIGHGALAAKALKSVLPVKDEFPYTIRIVSEILESNGSSSMATVCASCLSLMAAGVPIKNSVAGISIGLVTEGGKYSLLTDIMGLEDHFGDMDFKVAGTKNGITAIQLDIKLNSIAPKILFEGLSQAHDARNKVLANMTAVIDKPKAELSQFAPRILTINVPIEKIGEIIGPGGRMIKKIIEESKADSIDIDDDGKVYIASTTPDGAQRALEYIQGLTNDPIVGTIYDAVVVKIMNFGAFCEFAPGRQGLVHVSEFSSEFIKDLTQVVKVGERFKVKLVEIDKMGRMNLSKKQAETNEVRTP